MARGCNRDPLGDHLEGVAYTPCILVRGAGNLLRVNFGAILGVFWTNNYPKSQFFFAHAFGAREAFLPL